MAWCTFCRIDVPLDDVAIPLKSGRVMCLRCLSFRAESYRSFPWKLRRELESVTPELP